MELILASQSPRRQQLLRQMGLRFRVQVPHVDEAMDPARPPEEEVCRVSLIKARTAGRTAPEAIVVAADTIVVCEGQILGKPHSEEEAEQMLRLLSGRVHQVMTGYTVLQGDRTETGLEVSLLHFRSLAEAEIRAYVATGEPMDKAGAYGIQGVGGLFVRRLEGDYYNVMGLPICALTEVLRRFGVEILGCAEPEVAQ